MEVETSLKKFMGVRYIDSKHRVFPNLTDYKSRIVTEQDNKPFCQVHNRLNLTLRKPGKTSASTQQFWVMETQAIIL